MDNRLNISISKKIPPKVIVKEEIGKELCSEVEE